VFMSVMTVKCVFMSVMTVKCVFMSVMTVKCVFMIPQGIDLSTFYLHAQRVRTVVVVLAHLTYCGPTGTLCCVHGVKCRQAINSQQQHKSVWKGNFRSYIISLKGFENVSIN